MDQRRGNQQRQLQHVGGHPPRLGPRSRIPGRKVLPSTTADNVLVEASGEKYSNGLVGGFTAGTTPYANNQIAEYVYGDGVTAWYNFSTGRYEWYYTKRSPVLFF